MVVGIESFVGRSLELRRLDAAAQRGRAGAGGAVIVRGAAGVGKTSLVRVASEQWRAAGDRVVWSRCSPDPGAPDHWVWMQVLREVVGLVDDHVLEMRLGGGLEHLRRAVPGLPGHHGDGGTADADVFAFFDAARATIREAAARPLVVVLEDLHWADPESLRLLDLVARASHDVALTIVGTHRDLEAVVDPDRERRLDAISRVAEVIAVHGLDEAEVAALAESLTGQSCDAELARALHRRTGGNPYLVVTAIPHDGAPFADAARDPDTPTDLLGSAIAAIRRLDDGAIDLATDLAVLGGQAPEQDLVAISQEPEQVARRLHALDGQGIVSTGPRPGTWRFVHDLTQEAVLSMATPDGLARRHWMAAERLGSELTPGALAAHRLGAGSRAEPAAVIAACLRAAEAATDRYANDEAVRWLKPTLLLHDESDDHDEVDLLLLHARACVRAGRRDEAERSCRRALSVARLRGDPVAFARAAVVLAEASTHDADRTVAATVRPILAEALSGLGGGTVDPVLEAQLLAQIAAIDAVAGRVADASESARRCTALASQGGDARARHAALVAERWAMLAPSDSRHQEATTQRLALLAAQTENLHGQWWAARWQVRDGLESADPSLVHRGLAMLTSLARRMDEPALEAATLRQELAAASLEARVEDAVALLAAVEEPTPRAGVADTDEQLAQTVAVRALLSLPHADQPPAGGLLVHRALRAWSEIQRGDVAAAREAAGPLLGAETIQDLPPDHDLLPTLAFVAALAVETEDVSLASAVSGRLRPYEDRCIVLGANAPVWLGSVHHHLGRLAALCHDSATARGHLDVAVSVHQRAGAPLWTRWSKAVRVQTAGPDASSRPFDRDRGARSWILRRSGDTWEVGDGDRVARVPHRKGLRYVAELLRRPGSEVHVLDLAGVRDRGGAGPALDEAAKRAYRSRIEDLHETIAEGDAWADPERSARARAELDELAHELAAAVGLGGRDRPQVDAGERARVSVTKAIRSAIGVLEREVPVVGAHLRRSIRTGMYCAYEPSDDEVVTWVM